MRINFLQIKESIRAILMAFLLNAIGMMNSNAQTIVNADFESGNTGFQSDYTYVNSQYNGQNVGIESGKYTIDNTSNGHGIGITGWPTILGFGGSGKYMLVNGFGGANNPSKVVWKQTVNVMPNTDYLFSCQVVNLAQSVFGYNPNPAVLQLKINGTIVGTDLTIAQNNNWQEWSNFWNSGSSTQAVIEIYDVYTGDSGLGDDFGLDEITFTSLFPYCVITTLANPEEGGVVTGEGLYEIGTPCTLTAVANDGYYFLNWTENGEVVSCDAEYTFMVTGGRNLLANFVTNHWTAESYPNNMFMIGVVQIDGVEQASPALELGAFCNGECCGSEFPTYYEGRWLYYMNIGGYSGDSITFRLYDHSLQQEVNLFCFSEIPFESYGLIGMDDPYEVLFGKMSVVSVIVNPADAGIVTGSGNYLNGTEVTLTASSNSTFVNWTIGDEQVSTDTIYSFIVVEDVTVVANFLPRYEVTVSASPVEGGFISGAGIFDHGTSCTLVATAYDGYAFVNWSINDEIVSTESSYTFTITGPVDITANFGVLCPVSVFVSPEVAGTISGAGEYLFGTSVTLIATANEGYQFNSWAIDGEIVSTEASYTFTVTAPVSLTANFDLLCSVSADVNLEGAGTVTGEGEYLYGTHATLTATANAGYAFNNWTLEGEVVSTEPTYTFTVTAPMSLMANFNAVHMQQLVQGYNWLSTPVEITLDDLKSALVVALPGTTITINSQSDGSTTYNGARWRGSLNSLDLSQMYMVNVTADCEMTVVGLPIDPSEHVATIHPNFNWMAFPLRQSMTLTNAFAGFVVNGDMVISQSEGSSTYFNQWRGWLSTFEPGKGYMYKSNVQGDRTFTFPVNAK